MRAGNAQPCLRSNPARTNSARSTSPRASASRRTASFSPSYSPCTALFRRAACISDGRQAGKVEHSIRDLVRQRLFGIACGYADCNDAARLAEDPIQKLLIGRDPLTGAALASQPTLSGFENAPRRADLYRMGEGLAESVIERLRATFPKARILVRLDGGFGGPELLNFLEDEAKVDYIIGMAENKVLKRRAQRRMGRARRLSKRRGKTANVFGETRCAAKSWKGRKRRVLIKAEVVRLEGREPKDNERFVVTNLRLSPASV